MAEFGTRPDPATAHSTRMLRSPGWWLHELRDVPVLGIEPAANVAATAQEKGIPTLVRFFGRETAEELIANGTSADLLLGNNVLAHVPDLDDFVGGMKIALADRGVITMEFPHLLRLMEENQFDTIYHEHYSYLSFGTVREVFAAHELSMFDVEEIPTPRRVAAHLRAARPGEPSGEPSGDPTCWRARRPPGCARSTPISSSASR